MERKAAAMSADLVAACAAFIRSPHYWEATPRQIVLLGIMCDTDGPHEVRGLAAQMGVRKPIITRASVRLMEMGFILRMRHPQDKRIVQFVPTEMGRAVRQAMRRG